MLELILRSLLGFYMLAAFALAVHYLRYRRCDRLELVLWGALALFVPILGPFFVIAARPGPKKRLKKPRLARG